MYEYWLGDAMITYVDHTEMLRLSEAGIGGTFKEVRGYWTFVRTEYVCP